MFRFVILSVLLAAATAAPTENVFNVGSQCVSNPGALPISFQVEGCTSAPCALEQREDVVFNVKFSTPYDSEALRAQLLVYLGFGIPISIPYDLGTASQACDSLVNASCPVKEGQDLEYSLKLPIMDYFPAGTSVSLEMSLFDVASGSPAFCARVPVRIAAPGHMN